MMKLVFLLLLALPFTLNAQSLREYQWKNRVVLLIHKNHNSQQLIDQLSALQKRKEELEEREMLVIVPKPYQLPGTLNTLDIPYNFQGVVLVGKDGGSKYKGSFPVAPQLLLDLVDSMPMRRAEIKKRKDPN